MNKTIKELADSLGVSKTAVRKYMTDEFRAEHTETNRNGVITIDADGCNLIAESMGKRWDKSEPNENQFPESGRITENITIPKSVLDLMEEQLRQKDAQLTAKDQQIADLTATVRAQAESLQAEQALHAGTMKQMLPDGAPAEATDEVVELDQDEDVPEAASEPSEAQKAPEDALRGLSFGEKFKILFFKK